MHGTRYVKFSLHFHAPCHKFQIKTTKYKPLCCITRKINEILILVVKLLISYGMAYCYIIDNYVLTFTRGKF